MSGDDFLERLRRDAAGLRWDPGTEAVSRVAGRVATAIAERGQPPVTVVLSGWFRPALAGLAAAALVAIAALGWYGSDPADVLLAGADTAFSREVPDADLP